MVLEVEITLRFDFMVGYCDHNDLLCTMSPDITHRSHLILYFIGKHVTIITSHYFSDKEKNGEFKWADGTDVRYRNGWANRAQPRHYPNKWSCGISLTRECSSLFYTRYNVYL